MTGSPSPEAAAQPLLGERELSAWLWLLATPGVGRDGARRLLALCGSPEAVLAADARQLQAIMPEPAAQTLADALARPPADHAERLAQTLAWRQAAPARRLMVLGDRDYPPQLLHTADPPLLLYLEGQVGLLARRSVAIVGSRHATPQGRDNARSFAKALCERGWTIVSGMAAGIDGAAHEGALAAVAVSDTAAAASTIAVVGTGLDLVYPRAHRTLAARIVEHGLLVSELPLGSPPLAAHFPQRNRVIAGLSRGTLVVEAAVASGSLITARLALECGREVMAIPGSIHSPASRGCHLLIRQGAALVASPEDALAELESLPQQSELPFEPDGAARAAPSDAPADPVLDALGHDPATLDMLIDRCGWPAHQLSAHLLALELEGRVARLPGGLYQRLGSA